MSIVLATMTDGMSKIMTKDVTSEAQTNKGMRSRRMLGARCLKMVTMISTATARAAISVKVTICAQKSARLPGVYSGPARGTYENQPTSAAVLKAKAIQSIQPPNRYT